VTIPSGAQRPSDDCRSRKRIVSGYWPQKKAHTAPIKFPSFVYRQDGHELSYLIAVIITIRLVKVNLFLQELRLRKDFVDDGLKM
jgi:hypothetical protein